jgi:hypothetical protein
MSSGAVDAQPQFRFRKRRSRRPSWLSKWLAASQKTAQNKTKGGPMKAQLTTNRSVEQAPSITIGYMRKGDPA